MIPVITQESEISSIKYPSLCNCTIHVSSPPMHIKMDKCTDKISDSCGSYDSVKKMCFIVYHDIC
jgi:hypothetical protein